MNHKSTSNLKNTSQTIRGGVLIGKQKAFTLIELLVVIAIIGILAAVVLGAVGSVRGTAREAAVQATLRNMLTEAELFYGRNNSSYANLCEQPQIITMLDSIRDGNGEADCYTQENLHNRSWGAAAIVNDTYYAVNSQGVVEIEQERTGPTATSWNMATGECAGVGKKLPSAEMLRALHGAQGGGPVLSNFAWSSTEIPSTNNVYRVNMHTGALLTHDKTTTSSVTYPYCAS